MHELGELVGEVEIAKKAVEILVGSSRGVNVARSIVACAERSVLNRKGTTAKIIERDVDGGEKAASGCHGV